MADLSVIVDTDGASGDYSSLALAEAGEQAAYSNLVSGGNTITFICQATTGNADTALVTFEGWTTNAACFITVTVASGHRHGGAWDDTKYRLDTTGTNRGLQINVANFVADGLQIEPGDQNSDGINIDPAVSYDVTLKNIIMRTARWVVYAGNVNKSSGAITVFNTIGYGINAGCFAVDSGAASITLNLYNISCYNFNLLNTVYGFFCRFAANHARNIHNCIAVASAASSITDFDTTGSYTASNNISSDGSALGTNSLRWQSLSNIDWNSTASGSEDLRIGVDSAAISAGVNLDTIFTDDIEGKTRSTWDIGASEYAASETVVLAGSLSAAGTIGGNVTRTLALSGQLGGAATAASSIHIKKSLSGALSAAGAVEAALTVSGSVTLAGSLDGIASAAAQLGIRRSISGALDSTGSAAAHIGVRRPLAGSLSATAAAQAQVSAIKHFMGMLEAAGQISGTLSITESGKVSLAGNLSAMGTLQAALGIRTGLSGTVQAETDANGQVRLTVAMSGSAAAVASLAGSLSVMGESSLGVVIDPTIESVTIRRILKSITIHRTIKSI